MQPDIRVCLEHRGLFVGWALGPVVYEAQDITNKIWPHAIGIMMSSLDMHDCEEID